ncbi:ArsR/SmtB family transcription factor [Pseudoroseicyclus sp. H15]
MEMNSATTAFAALSQPTRLSAFRLLVQAGSEGIAAGDLAERLASRPNTLSANLSVLLSAGLVSNRREGRSIRYFAELPRFSALLEFMMEECCGGRPELCRPAIAEAIGSNT